ncbi:hypothetical protein TI39_contig610g00006 [Zymoseptoria brevis]|uniref:Uncharacterized protein n=1 Tax=Zymoseptoria brevis TaxID=1047168 RepID=A0A0F4GHX8_9PEZI|nr:hypothetical protein TI39_contig610g00006 [Zymoseptoria brevis]
MHDVWHDFEPAIRIHGRPNVFQDVDDAVAEAARLDEFLETHTDSITQDYCEQTKSTLQKIRIRTLMAGADDVHGCGKSSIAKLKAENDELRKQEMSVVGTANFPTELQPSTMLIRFHERSGDAQERDTPNARQKSNDENPARTPASLLTGSMSSMSPIRSSSISPKRRLSKVAGASADVQKPMATSSASDHSNAPARTYAAHKRKDVSSHRVDPEPILMSDSDSDGYGPQEKKAKRVTKDAVPYVKSVFARQGDRFIRFGEFRSDLRTAVEETIAHLEQSDSIHWPWYPPYRNMKSDRSRYCVHSKMRGVASSWMAVGADGEPTESCFKCKDVGRACIVMTSFKSKAEHHRNSMRLLPLAQSLKAQGSTMTDLARAFAIRSIQGRGRCSFTAIADMLLPLRLFELVVHTPNCLKLFMLMECALVPWGKQSSLLTVDFPRVQVQEKDHFYFFIVDETRYVA